LFVAVRTESRAEGSYDQSQVEQLLTDLQSLGPIGAKHLVICCNVNPGTCDTVHERMSPLGYAVSYNPEWVAQGTILGNLSHPDLIVIGEASPAAGDQIARVHARICFSHPKIHRMDRMSAELTKIALNCFLTTKIAYANMIGQIALKSGRAPEPILSALGDDSRINARYLRYGFGFGGPCFSRDNQSLISHAQSIGAECGISEAVRRANNNHLEFQVEHFASTHDRSAEVVLDSVTYKPGTVIVEHSQQLRFAVRLAELGYRVTIREHPEVVRQVREQYGSLFGYEEAAPGPS
jgi:nucleotide sugar dehydrogenase